MKLSRPKYYPFSSSYTRTGRKNGYKVEINYNSLNKIYYFLLEKGEEYAFNSCWENARYSTEEDCIVGAEKYIEALTKMEGSHE